MSAGTRFSFVIGIVMIVLGIAVALAPLLAPTILHRPSVTPSRWLDVVFAFFFIVRGAMNVRMAQRQSARRETR